MITTRESAFEAVDPKVRDTESNNTMDALRRMHDDIDALRKADATVGGEMNKVKVVCQPPPITPPCHGEAQPPDPIVVRGAMLELNTANRKLNQELEGLQVGAKSAGKEFERDLKTLGQQVQGMDSEIAQLNGMTQLRVGRGDEYEKSKVLSETEKIEKMAKAAEKTRKILEKDLGL